ncbi:MAG: hypothetical protein GAK37_01591 [Pseudomonas sp.]|nr:MAG: hypothetical protein GAK37_01591 [Pseudomonas sp.]
MLPFKALALAGALVALPGMCTQAASPWPESPLEWQLDCPRLPGRPRDEEILARTQCATVTVPLDHNAPAQGTLRLHLTRVGARQPLHRQGAVFIQHGELPAARSGAFAVHLASLWKYLDTPADRTLANHYDVIELSPRNLTLARQLEQSARDLELVRSQLAEEHPLYLGSASPLGARYAQLYPGRLARRVLLDDTWWQNPAPCANHAVADYLAYGKHPSPASRCPGVAVYDESFTTLAH